MSRLFDCFTFCDELDLLEIRLHELEAVVDQFVLVEGRYTFQGERKSLHFAENRDRFAHWPITVVTLEHEHRNWTTWQRENAARDAITDALVGVAGPDDRVLMSDVDEIPRASVLQHARPSARLKGTQYYFKLDWRIPIQVHHNYPTLVRFHDLSVEPPSVWRYRQDIEPLADAGWHFSCLGDGGQLARKLRSFAHDEIAEEVKDADYLQRCIDNGVDMLGRFQCDPVNVDYTYPRWLRENLDRFGHHLRKRDQ